jgi:hypothetical protein
MDQLKIRFNTEQGKYFVYFNSAFGHCAYESDPFDTLAEAEDFLQEQMDSADFSEE